MNKYILSILIAVAGTASVAYACSGCTYNGQQYSDGSVVTMSDGKSYKCDCGSWVAW